MRSHADIDRRSLWLAQAIAARIDGDPDREGLQQARRVCARWRTRRSAPALREWAEILTLPWERVKPILLDGSPRGQRLRQSSPFCGILTPRERWRLYREFADATD